MILLLPPNVIIAMLREAFSAKVSRATGIAAGLLYAVFYLFATGIVSYYPNADISQYAKIPYVSMSFSEAIGWSPF